MRNDQCIIRIFSEKGFDQTYHKVKRDQWIQETYGIERIMTAEQVLSHILPLLAHENKGSFKLEVKYEN